MYKRLAKTNSYDGTRKLTDIKGIVIHWTAGSFDTAKNNVDFLQRQTHDMQGHIILQTKRICRSFAST